MPCTCSCGATESHIIMRRTSADGVHVCVWDDGAVTGMLGRALDGVPLARPKGHDAIERQRIVGNLFASVCELYDANELGDVYRAARWVAARPNPSHAAVRARVAATTAPTIALHWTVTATDRNGRVTARQARLPRLGWPGLAVIDERDRRGRYHIVNVRTERVGGVVTREYAEGNGMSFGRLSDLTDYLISISLASGENKGAR